jgi:HTH-type transcriptional regulator/antitoxin HigA
VQRELAARGWTQKDLARIMQRPAQAINEIVKGGKQITPETAIELREAFGTSPEFWTHLEVQYRLHIAQKEKPEKDIVRAGRLYSLAPVRELIKRGWIRNAKTLAALEKEICAFLDIASPDETPRLAVNFRHGNVAAPEFSAQVAWVRRGEQLGDRQKVSDFSLARLKKSMASIRAFAERAEDVARVPGALAELGIRFVVVPPLPRTCVDGVALYDGRPPILALSLRYSRIDTFWFTLMHELAHIAARHKEGHVERMDDSVATTAIDVQESEANQMAMAWLVEQQALADFVQEVAPNFSRSRIEQFAVSQRQHPGIVVGQLQHGGHMSYANLRNLLVDVRGYLRASDG